MEFGLKGRVALVPAASKGIGFGVAKVLASEGCKVVISSRNQDSIRKATEQIVRETGNREAYGFTTGKRSRPRNGQETVGSLDIHNLNHPETTNHESAVVEHCETQRGWTVKIPSNGVGAKGNNVQRDNAGTCSD